MEHSNKNNRALVQTDVVWAKYYGSHYLGVPKSYTWITVKSSNSAVATATAHPVYQDGKAGLQVDFPKGSIEGSATITVGFTVTELSIKAGIASDSQTA